MVEQSSNPIEDAVRALERYHKAEAELLMAEAALTDAYLIAGRFVMGIMHAADERCDGDAA